MKIYGVIYKVTNLINDKKYIGQTVDLDSRMRNHLSVAKKGNGYALHNAIKKYGKENFNWSIIDQAYSKDELDDKESFWIDYYKSFRDYGKGYNLTFGGDGGVLSEETKRKISKANSGENSGWWGKKHTEETKRKIGEGNKGKRYSDEAKKKISDSKKKYVGENHPRYGKEHSDETKMKMRENHKNGKYVYKGSEIVVLTLNFEFIAEFKTIKEASIQMRCNRNFISRCCRGIREHYLDCIWMYKKDYEQKGEKQ